ncbi:MAG: hypothetical protein JSR98_21525 [Proteobacteria bacterium]|nr:hypothetical protein [Pseudomonadota bacterium]
MRAAFDPAILSPWGDGKVRRPVRTPPPPVGELMRGLAVSTLATAGATIFAALTLGVGDARADLAAPTPYSLCYGAVEGAFTSCAGNGATVDITYDHPSVFATASSTGVAEGFGALDYNFVITGGQAGTYVTLDVQTLLQWSTVGGGAAFSEIVVDSGVAQTFHTICSYCGVGPGFNEDSSYAGTLQLLAQVGTVGTIHLEAQASAGTGGGATALADPLLFIDPSADNAAQYGFAFSPGVTNGVNQAGGAPEPGIWMLMMLGFGFGGAVLRARRAAAFA